MGRQAAAATGDSGRVAQGPGHVAVPGAHLQLSRHHVPDARGGPEVHDCGQNVQRPHENRLTSGYSPLGM